MTLVQHVKALAQAVGIDIKALSGRIDGLPKLAILTQAQYDALTDKEPNTLYVVKS